MLLTELTRGTEKKKKGVKLGPTPNDSLINQESDAVLSFLKRKQHGIKIH